ncbi:MAG: hypothetical protein JO267_14685 [Alphaproteobacteria bacterium]|nr:hypothetical protein [Alphaproteobacteria bacterium]
MKARRAPGQSGFLLLELLVALALAGLVGLLLVNGVRLAALGLDRLSAHADRLEDRRAVEDLLRRLLAEAVPLPVVADQRSFIGRPASLRFVTLAGDAGPGLYRIDLDLEARGGERDLVLTRRLADPSAQPGLQRSVLLHRVASFGLAYYGAMAPNEAPAWHEAWDSMSYPPSLVRVTAESDDGLSRPPLVVRLRGVTG